MRLNQQEHHFLEKFSDDFSNGIPETEEDIYNLMEKLEVSANFKEIFEEDLNRYRSLSWDEEDEIYYFSLRQEIDEIPIALIDTGILEDNIEVIQSQNGIEFMRVSGLVEIIEFQQKISIIGSVDALDIVEEFYSKSLNLLEPRVQSMELSYVLNEESILVPVWFIGISQLGSLEQGNDEREVIYHLVNAVTGEFIN